MIDTVNIYIKQNIELNQFKNLNQPESWTTLPSNRGGEFIHYGKRGIHLYYFPNTKRLYISGKLIALIHQTQVLNEDDVFGRDIESFIDEVNARVNDLFNGLEFDIKTFIIRRCDFCYNVNTPFVKEYLQFLRQAFLNIDSGSKVEYCLLNHKDGSLYIKNKGEYKNNARYNWTLNFYSKLNMIQKTFPHPAEEDLSNAKDVLRLEVQLSYKSIASICNKHNFEKIFGNFLNFDLAYESIAEIYKRVFRANDQADFYSYEEAKSLLPRKSIARNDSAAQVLLRASRNGKITETTYDNGRKKILNCGIFPYFFLPKDWRLQKLDNPLKLIQDKIDHLK